MTDPGRRTGIGASKGAAAERTWLTRLIQQAPAFICVLRGPDHVFELANDHYLKLVGHRDIIGKPVLEALPEIQDQGFKELLDGVLATGQPFIGRELPAMLERAPEAELEQRYVNFVYQPMVDADGTRSGVFVHGVDVTDQVLARREVEQLNQQLQEQATELEMQTEELQVASEELAERTAVAEVERKKAERARTELAEILEAMTDAHFVLDAEFRFVRANRAMERSGRVGRDGLLGRTLWESFPGAIAKVIERRYRQVVDDKTEAHFAYDYKDERTDLVVEIDAYPTPAGGISVFWRDITSRVRSAAERERLLADSESMRTALSASEARYRSLAAVVPVQVWTAQPDGHLSFVNEHATKYFGAQEEQLLGIGWVAFLHPDDVSVASEQWAHALSTGTPYETEFRLRSAIGEYRWHLARALPEHDAAGNIIGWAGSNTDVESERRARAEAENANRAKSEFLAVMSHELRTPLNAIAGYTELIELGIHGPTTPEQQLDLERIQKSQRHLLGLINGVLNFAKVGAGAVHYAVEPVPMHEVLESCEALIAPQMRSKELDFHLSPCDSALSARADRDKVQQIVLNLLSNAVKFTGEGGRVALECSPDSARHVVVRVTDTGRGIATDHLDRIFQPFVQVDAKLTRAESGTGLGLAISKDLARGMGGDLLVESVLGKGSTFILVLPAEAQVA